MKRSRAHVLLALAFLAAPLRAQTDEQVETRHTVLELAGAFANDGFKVRDGHYFGTLKLQARQLVAVNLYAGNQYWFSVGALTQARKIAVTVYDETGLQMKTETYDDGAKAAAGFSPVNSGQYYIGVTLTAGDESPFCLVYSYK